MLQLGVRFYDTQSGRFTQVWRDHRGIDLVGHGGEYGRGGESRMRFLSYTGVLIFTCIIATLWVFGCQLKDRAVYKSEVADPLLRITAYAYNPDSLQVTLDMSSRRIRAIHKRYDPKAGSYIYTVREASASQAEVTALAKKVTRDEHNLRNFKPELSWFKGIPPPHTGDVVEIKWKRQSVFIARPRDSMYLQVPEEAKILYSDLGMIEGGLCDIGHRLYFDSVSVRKVGSNNPLAKAFEQEWSCMMTNSLPRGRLGW